MTRMCRSILCMQAKTNVGVAIGVYFIIGVGMMMNPVVPGMPVYLVGALIITGVSLIFCVESGRSIRLQNMRYS